jgi:hypothetical protein
MPIVERPVKRPAVVMACRTQEVEFESIRKMPV